MSIHCSSNDDYSDWEWRWEWDGTERHLDTKRSRKCCSCGTRIATGGTVARVSRARKPSSFLDECIYGDEVPLANWYLCETCNDIALSLQEQGLCFELGAGESIQAQVAEYMQA